MEPDRTTIALTPAPALPSSELNTIGELGLEQQKNRLLASLFEIETEPTRLGRYVLLGPIGRGGMGVVYAAFDEQLERKVAVKLLRARGSDEAQSRLRREAKAMARVMHPNVVQIYEIGEVDRGSDEGGRARGLTFIVMEFVRGQTLRQWLDQSRPSIEEILATFSGAGQGLVAAHAKGLVHRDVKLDNIMIDRDGRVLLMDFGIAHVGEELRTSSLEGLARTEPLEDLTASGAVLGTPAYMAPEQLMSGATTEATDQFSFCVALWEALYGERPYAGETLAELAAAGSAGVCSPAGSSRVPAWLRAVVERGLAPRPQGRWPSMEALLGALADDPVARRRKWWLGAGVVGALAGGAWGLAQVVEHGEGICEGMEDRLEGVWDDTRRAQLRAAIDRVDLSYGHGTWTRVEAGLDAYTASWVATRTDICKATRRGEQSAALLDLRMACLDERLTHVAATVEVLGEADEEGVKRAVEVVTGLPGLGRCMDSSVLEAELPAPDPELAEGVAALEEQLALVEALAKAGSYPRGLELAEEVVASELARDYAPLQVHAWLRKGDLQDRRGDYEGAAVTLKQAYELALSLRMSTEAASASAGLVHVLGFRLARHQEGRAWAVHAEPLSRAARSDGARAQFLATVGAMAQSEGDYEEARGHLEGALALREKTQGPEHLALARVLNQLGNVADWQGEYKRARGYHERALAIQEGALGPDHPVVAVSLGNLGLVAYEHGEYEQARDYVQRALPIFERALGPDHRSLAVVHNTLGLVAMALGEYERARGDYERSLAIWERALGPEHPDVAMSLTNLGLVAYALVEDDQARAYHERALAIRQAALGPTHSEVGASLNNLGMVAYVQGELEQAQAYHEEALTIFVQALGPTHTEVANCHSNLGKVANSRDQFERARDHHEQALAIRREALGPAHAEVGQSLENLGMVAYREGDHEQALGYHQRALLIYEQALGPTHPDVARLLIAMGDARMGEHDPAGAITHFERALSIQLSNEEAALELAPTRFALALALWDAPDDRGRDRSRARRLAELARSAYAEDGERSSAELDEVRQWQREHGG